MTIFRFAAVFAFAFSLVNCASYNKSGGRSIAQAGGFASSEAQWQEMKQIAATLDMTGSGITLGQSSGGTSVYSIIKQNGTPIGAVIPENAATKLSGEILAYTLARAFGISEIYQPGVYFALNGKNLEAFKNNIPTTPYNYGHKEKNRVDILQRIANNPNGIDAIFKKWDNKPNDYDAMVSVSANTLNTSHVLAGSSQPFASFLQCNGPQPSKSVTVTMNKGTTTEYEAARQLSSILLIDAIVKQWDRFSGGNLQTVTKNGVVSFVSYDNGGTWAPGWTSKNLSFVSRFDRNVAQQILDLDSFLRKEKNSFQGLKNEDELMAALGIENFPKVMNTLRGNLNDVYNLKTIGSIIEVAAHIRKHNCFFE